MRHIPTFCPSCSEELHIRSLHCTACDTTISGDFELPVLLRLPPAEQEFVLEFVLSSGSLKEMARKMGLSYPTVRNKLDEIIDRIEKNRTHETSR